MRLTRRPRQEGTSARHGFAPERELWRINWRAHGYPFCGVYAVSPDNRWPTKIGISQNPLNRLINLQCASWRRLDIAEYFFCADQQKARQIEAKCHAILTEDGKALHGEWFDIRPDKAAEIIAFAGAALGIEVRRDIPDERARLAILEICANLDQQEWIASGEAIEATFSPDGMIWNMRD